MERQRTEKPAIEYPCRWSYKLIGHTEEDVRLAAHRCMATQFGTAFSAREPRLDRSRTSSGGKFHSLNLTVRVEAPEERLGLFKILGEAPEILIVI